MAPIDRYHLYGVTLESDLDLPEVPRAPATADPAASIRLGVVETDGLPGGRMLGPYLSAAPRALWFSVPEVARFVVRDGREIIVDPHPFVDEDTLRAYLLGSALGAMLHQRGLIVLHGNAIRIGDGCLVCVGPSGAGKSTLAAEFMRRGYRILSDDVVPVDGKCRALPGFPRLKLWQDAASRLDICTDALRRVSPNVAKFNYPLSDLAFSTESVPVRWIYALSVSTDSPLGIAPVRGMGRLIPLHANTYRFGFLEAMGLQAEHLEGCGRLAGCAAVRVLTRPGQGVSPKQVADLLLADLGQPG